MEYLEWDKKYEVGNIEIDSEHRVFVRLIQKIITAVENKKNLLYIERLINEIYKYADFHFYSEETIMYEIDYPDIEMHQREHRELMLDLKNMIVVSNNESFSRPMSEFIDFLIKWFRHHTVNVDKKLAEYIRAVKKSDRC